MTSTGFFGHGRSVILVALVASGVFGCSGSDRMKKQVAGLESQLTTLRADQDRMEERLAAVELSATVTSKGAPTSSVERERVERPRLKVIHLAPDEEESAGGGERATEPAQAAAPDAAARRPIIRGTGDRVIKVGDGDSDETSRTDDAPSKRVAERETHRN